MMSKEDIILANLKKFHGFKNINHKSKMYDSFPYYRDYSLRNGDYIKYYTGNVIKFDRVNCKELRELDNSKKKW